MVMQTDADRPLPRLLVVRPLVRYVDESQAVIETHIKVRADCELNDVAVGFELVGPEGQTFTHRSRITLADDRAVSRFEMSDPQRWWPAGMGEQLLYDFSVSLIVNDCVVDTWQTTLGMTSVRRVDEGQLDAQLLVNGRACEIHTVLTVEPQDEQAVLPVTEHSLLVVRGHFAPDILFDTADRMGILLIQSIPLHREPRLAMRAAVNRLAMHPSLAGWFVERAGSAANRIAAKLHTLDPTRNIFRQLPC